MRYITMFVIQAAFVVTGWGVPAAVSAQSETYELVPNWPNFSSGTFFGTLEGWPDQAARDRAVAARRALQARGQAPARNQGLAPPQQQLYGQGVSGIAIDDQDREDVLAALAAGVGHVEHDQVFARRQRTGGQ